MTRYGLLLIMFLSSRQLLSQPIITSFSPTSGPVGSAVTIKGNNFNTVASQNVVYFGAVQAVVSLAANDSLVVTVPPGASYQPITVTSNNLTAYSAKPFNVTFNGVAGPFTSNSFLPKSNLTLSSHPYALASGDFDGDGRADLLVPLAGPDSVAILRNTSSPGNISFSSPSDFLTTTNDDEECAVADLDGDGKLDFLITYGNTAHTFSVFRNTSVVGNISFASKIDYSTSTNNVFFVATNDLNGDGKPEIIAANYPSGTVSIYVNTSTPGNISFSAPTSFATNASAYFVTTGDIDGDGKPDVLVLTSSGNSVLSVLRNTSTGGNISFAPNANLISLSVSQFISIADLDNDGELDIAAINGNAVAVLRNLSTPGNISFSAAQTFASGNGSICTSVSDLNGDGKPDLLVLNQSDSSVSLLRNTSTAGNISFDARINFGVDYAPFMIIAQDLDEDQKPDIISCNFMGYTISILRNGISTGPAPTISSFAPTSGIAGTQVKIHGSNFINVTSINFGGVPASSFTIDSATGITAIVGNGASGPVAVTGTFGTATLPGFTYLGPTITSFTPTKGIGGTSIIIRGLNFTGATSVTFGGAPASSFTVDSSTKITAIVGTGSSGVVTVVTPGGTATLAGFIYNPPLITSFAPTSGPIGTSVSISGHGFDPILSHNTVYFGPVKAVISAGTDSTLVATVPTGSAYQPISVTAYNLTAYSSKPFDVTFTGAGDSLTSLSFMPKQDFVAGSYPRSVACGDFDGDGKTDLVVVRNGVGVVSILKNTSIAGTTTLAPKLDLPAVGNGHWSAAVADIDGDGKLDFALINVSADTVSIYRNTSSGGTISFAPSVDYKTDTASLVLTLADLNGDGKPDLIVAEDSQSDSISVFRNVSTPGNILFDKKSNFYSGSDPFGFSISDFDGDGRPDLAMITAGASQSLIVMRNISSAGNISFAPMINISSLASPFFVVAGDIDADGKPDLVATQAPSNKVSVFRNLGTPGNISFAAKIDYATGVYPVGAAIGDVDGDGKPDIATLNFGDSTVSVLKNVSTPGVISFLSQVQYSVDAQPNWVVINDVDGDGRPDIITANSSADSISVLQNIIGANVAPVITSFSPTYGLSGLVVTISGSNFNGASRVTFGGIPATSFTVDSSTGITAVVASGATGNVSVTTKYGTATLPGFVYGMPPIITSFTPHSGAVGTMITIVGSHFGANPSNDVVYFGAVKATISGGNDSSLIVTVPVGTTYDAITVNVNNLIAYSDQPFNVTFPNDGRPFSSTTFGQKIDFGTGDFPHSVATGDFDGDGKPDLLVARGSSNSVTVFKNASSNSTISFAQKQDFPAAREQEGCAVGDLDGDGKLDFVVANAAYTNSISIYRNTSTAGNISFASKIDYPTDSGPYIVTIGDINGDGKPDLVVADDGSDSISIYKNLSTPGNILFDRKLDLYSQTNPYGVVIGDLDGDGRPDLAMLNQSTTGAVWIMRNTGVAGNIAFAPPLSVSVLSDPTYLGGFFVSFGDADGDGKPDLIATGFDSVSVRRNLSTPGNLLFGPANDFPVGRYVTCVAMGDLDGDGKPDLVTSNWMDNNISVLKNNSTPGNIDFDSQVVYAVDANPYYVTISDFDGDSRPDIAVANSSSDSVSILRNLTNIITGIVNIGNDQYFKFYPNPVTNNLNVFWKINGINLLKATLTDLQGRQVLSIPHLQSGDQIDLRRFSPGAYFLRLYNDRGRIDYTVKIVKG